MGTRMKITDLDEGVLDLFRGSSAIGLDNLGNMAGKTQAAEADVNRKALELLNRGMPQQQIIQALRQEFGVNQDSAIKALRMAQAGLVETTSAGSVASVAVPVGGLVSRQMKNPDGTAKNGLDSDNVLSNGKPKSKKKSKQA